MRVAVIEGISFTLVHAAAEESLTDHVGAQCNIRQVCELVLSGGRFFRLTVNNAYANVSERLVAVNVTGWDTSKRKAGLASSNTRQLNEWLVGVCVGN